MIYKAPKSQKENEKRRKKRKKKMSDFHTAQQSDFVCSRTIRAYVVMTIDDDDDDNDKEN